MRQKSNDFSFFISGRIKGENAKQGKLRVRANDHDTTASDQLPTARHRVLHVHAKPRVQLSKSELLRGTLRVDEKSVETRCHVYEEAGKLPSV